MIVRNLFSVLAVLGVLSMAATSQAEVIMDGTIVGGVATKHNGDLELGTFGAYWDNATVNPPEWTKIGSHVYNGAGGRTEVYLDTQIFNNTGELVVAGTEYTLSALLGDRLGAQIDVYVRATENIDGTGAFSDLAHITRTGSGNETNFDLVLESSTGTAAGSGIAGYYIQVLVETGSVDLGQSYFFDQIVVTSELVPEPASVGLMFASGVLLLGQRRKKS